MELTGIQDFRPIYAEVAWDLGTTERWDLAIAEVMRGFDPEALVWGLTFVLRLFVEIVEGRDDIFKTIPELQEMHLALLRKAQES